MNKLSIIIPIYNERKNIGKVIDAIKTTMRENKILHELIVVDDCSSDGVRDILESKRQEITLLQHQKRRGYGAALKTGIDKADGDIICIIDGDNTYFPSDIHLLVPFIDEYDMVVGARVKDCAQNFPLYQRIAKGFVCSLVGLIFKQNIPDINSGLRLIKKNVAQRYLAILCDGFSFTASITLAMLLDKRQIKYVPIGYSKRVEKSNIKIPGYIVNFIKSFWRVIYRLKLAVGLQVMSKKKVFLIFSVISGLALSLFLLKRNYFIDWGVNFALPGKNLVTGLGFTAWGGRPQLHQPPFYPFLIGIFYKFIGNLEFAAHLVSIVAFLVSIVFFFKLAEFIYNKKAAYFATFLFVTHPLILEYSHLVFAHSVDILLIIAAIYLASLIIKNEELKYKNFIFLGIILSCAILNRPDNIILSLAIIINIFIQKKKQILRKIIPFMCLIGVLAGLLFPYANFLHSRTGKWTLTTKITDLQFYEYLSSKEPESIARLKQKTTPFTEFKPLKYIKENRQELLKRYQKSLPRFLKRLTVVLYFGFGYILIVLGLFGQAWNRDRRKIEILLFSCLAPMIILPLGVLFPRYFISTLPIFLLWMAMGLETLFIFIKNYFNLSNKKLALVIGLVLIFLILPTGRFLLIQKNTPQEKRLSLEDKEMGLWMRDNIEDINNKKICSCRPFVVFYSGGVRFDLASRLSFEQNTWSSDEKKYLNFIELLKKDKIDYVIISQRFIPELFPQLKFLLDDKEKHKGLVKVHAVKKYKKIILYKVE